MQKEELNAKLVLEKDECEKKLREIEWTQRMKEADDIESRILGEKEAKMKRDWMNTQTAQTNCPNCVDISHYYMLMETYMEKLIMYLISEKNLVLTYEYREYCHYQTENKMGKDAEAYVKRWYEFTKDLVAKALKKIHSWPKHYLFVILLILWCKNIKKSRKLLFRGLRSIPYTSHPRLSFHSQLQQSQFLLFVFVSEEQRDLCSSIHQSLHFAFSTDSFLFEFCILCTCCFGAIASSWRFFTTWLIKLTEYYGCQTNPHLHLLRNCGSGSSKGFCCSVKVVVLQNISFRSHIFFFPASVVFPFGLFYSKSFNIKFGSGGFARSDDRYFFAGLISSQCPWSPLISSIYLTEKRILSAFSFYWKNPLNQNLDVRMKNFWFRYECYAWEIFLKTHL